MLTLGLGTPYSQEDCPFVVIRIGVNSPVKARLVVHRGKEEEKWGGGAGGGGRVTEERGGGGGGGREGGGVSFLREDMEFE